MKPTTIQFAFLLTGLLISTSSASVPPVPIKTRVELEAARGLDLSVRDASAGNRLVTLDAEPRDNELLRHVRLQIVNDDLTVLDVPLSTERMDDGFRVTFTIDAQLAEDAVILVSFGTKDRAERRYRIQLGAFVPQK